jgi:hypothetical protein
MKAAEDANATAASKTVPAKGMMNTPEAEKAMQKKGNGPDLVAGVRVASRLLNL